MERSPALSLVTCGLSPAGGGVGGGGSSEAGKDKDSVSMGSPASR